MMAYMMIIMFVVVFASGGVRVCVRGRKGGKGRKRRGECISVLTQSVSAFLSASSTSK